VDRYRRKVNISDLYDYRDTVKEDWELAALTKYLHAKNLLKKDAFVMDIIEKKGFDKTMAELVFNYKGNILKQEKCHHGRSLHEGEFYIVKIPEPLQVDQDELRQEYSNIEV